MPARLRSTTADVGQIGAHRVNGRPVVLSAEYRRADHKRISPCSCNLSDISHCDAAVDFQSDVMGAGIDQRSRLAQFGQGTGK